MIQLYFHEFRAPVPAHRAAPEPLSPIKTMSYAIEDNPWRPWRELVTLSALICLSLAFIV